MMHRHNMNKPGTNRGVALVSALMVVSIAAGMFAAIMYYTLTGTEISGLQRKYQSSKEASIGAIDVLTKDILPQVMGGSTLTTVVTNLAKPSAVLPSVTVGAGGSACFTTKLTTATASWGTCNKTTDATSTPDIVFNLKGKSNQTLPYVVNMKIVDTVTGNTDTSGTVLDLGSGVVDTSSSLIQVQHFPYLYTIMTDARPQGSTTERANIEVLYAY